MKSLSADILERIMTAAQEGVTGWVGGRTYQHLLLKRGESKGKEVSWHVYWTVFSSELAQFFGLERS